MSKTKLALVFTVVTILLTLGFYRNQWKAAGKKWFYDWKKNSDMMVVGRLVESRQKGTFSDGGLLGWEETSSSTPEHQFDTYLQNGTFETYFAYKSTTALHGIIFGWIDQVTGFQPAFNLKLFRGMTSVLSAMALALIIIWFLNELSLLSALFVAIFIMLSEWLALYGGSMYWQLWSLYVPAIGVGIYLLKEKQETAINYKVLAGIVIAATLIKCLFNGFEFITVSLAMMGIPVVYYSLARKWNSRTFFMTGLMVTLGALVGILISLFILFIQITAVTGDFQQAVEYLSFSLGKRVVGIETEGSVGADLWLVLRKYIFEGRAINLSNWIHISGPVWLQSQLEIPYYRIFVLFLFFSLVFVIFMRWQKESALFQKTAALFYTTWIAILPPLSWFVIFKAHSYIHTQLNYVIWQMPFTLFGFAFCGMVITCLLSLRAGAAKPAPPDTGFEHT